jgi:hypothetical protein
MDLQLYESIQKERWVDEKAVPDSWIILQATKGLHYTLDTCLWAALLTSIFFSKIPIEIFVLQ